MHNAPLNWHAVCGVEDIDEEDLIDFEHDGKPYAVYHTRSGFYATDAICTHEYANLCSGMVLGEIVECPRHQGRFHTPTGKAKGAPVVVDLRTYPTKIDGGQIYIGLPEEENDRLRGRSELVAKAR